MPAVDGAVLHGASNAAVTPGPCRRRTLEFVKAKEARMIPWE